MNRRLFLKHAFTLTATGLFIPRPTKLIFDMGANSRHYREAMIPQLRIEHFIYYVDTKPFIGFTMKDKLGHRPPRVINSEHRNHPHEAILREFAVSQGYQLFKP